MQELRRVRSGIQSEKVSAGCKLRDSTCHHMDHYMFGVYCRFRNYYCKYSLSLEDFQTSIMTCLN